MVGCDTPDIPVDDCMMRGRSEIDQRSLRERQRCPSRSERLPARYEGECLLGPLPMRDRAALEFGRPFVTMNGHCAWIWYV